MHDAVRPAGLFVPALLLAACSPPMIDIETRRLNNEISVTLSQDWGLIFPSRQAPCVRNVTLYRGNEEAGIPIWRAEAGKNIECADTLSFFVGKAPTGLSTIIPLDRSAKGSHLLVVDGIGTGIATITLP